MTTAALISLRETFEAALVVCVMLTYLQRSNQRNFISALWLGVGAGIVFSVVLAWLMQIYAASLGDKAKEIYEGIMMIVAAGLLLWMIGWMAASGRNMKAHIEKNMAMHIAGGSAAGIFFLSFTSTAREGAEMALLIHATLLSTSHIHALAGIGIGMVIALAIAALMLRGVRLIPLQHFFTITGVFLLVLGAGLTMHGIGEFHEAGTISVLSTTIWDTSWLLADDTLVADIAKIIIGYEATPSILQILGGSAYALVAMATWKIARKPRRHTAAV